MEQNPRGVAAAHVLMSRRTLVAGTAWGAPLALTAPPVTAAATPAPVAPGPLRFADRTVALMDAVCASSARSPGANVPRVRVGYGRVWLPSLLEVCGDPAELAWYRLRESVSPGSVQLELDGRHDARTAAGHRPGFRLDPQDGSGGRRSFALTYRTSATRPWSGADAVPSAPGTFENVSLTLELQRSVSTSASEPATGWTTVRIATVKGRAWRTARASPTDRTDPIDFRSRSSQSPGRRPHRAP